MTEGVRKYLNLCDVIFECPLTTPWNDPARLCLLIEWNNFGQLEGPRYNFGSRKTPLLFVSDLQVKMWKCQIGFIAKNFAPAPAQNKYFVQA